MRNKILIRLLLLTALLVLAFPIAASAQNYRERYYNPDYSDQYRYDVRGAINQLDNSSARLQNDLNYGSTRRVWGIFQFRTVDNSAIEEVRDFRRAVRQLRNASANGRDLRDSTGAAQVVLDRGVRLDRSLRLRTNSTAVDSELADIRSSLHRIADAYDLSMPY